MTLLQLLDQHSNTMQKSIFKQQLMRHISIYEFGKTPFDLNTHSVSLNQLCPIVKVI